MASLKFEISPFAIPTGVQVEGSDLVLPLSSVPEQVLTEMLEEFTVGVLTSAGIIKSEE